MRKLVRCKGCGKITTLTHEDPSCPPEYRQPHPNVYYCENCAEIYEKCPKCGDIVRMEACEDFGGVPSVRCPNNCGFFENMENPADWVE